MYFFYRATSHLDTTDISETAHGALSEEEVQPPLTGRYLAIEKTEDENIAGEETCVVYKNSLLSLVNRNFPNTCTKRSCEENVSIKTERVGTAIYLIWVIFFY